MGLLDKLKGEFIDIIEWLEEDDTTIAYRFERYGNEIKNGAQLTVREGQTAIFVNEGKLADVFDAGMYELTTQNLPILSTLKGWKYGFASPFKAECIFITRRIITGFGWGTPSPFRLRDPEFGILEMTARGHFSFHVIEPSTFLKKVVGTDGEFTKEEIRDRLRKKFVTEAITAIAESGKSFYEMAGQMSELSEILKGKVEVAFFEQYGIALEDTSIQSIDLTERSAEKVEKRDEVMFNDGRMNMYERQARADAMVAAASNPGGGNLAGQAMGMGMGLNMANQMAGAFAATPGGAMPGMAVAPPPPSLPTAWYTYVNGRQQGPFDHQAVSQLVAGGQLTPETHVWKQGMAGWVPAANAPELGSLFDSATPAPSPPPPPPPEG
ncbi:MAG: SPFH domain-containing protein [Spirochaetaceae bacterium]